MSHRLMRAVQAPRRPDPSSISGLVSWFRADSITGVADGVAPSNWPDKTGAAPMTPITGPPTAAVWKASILNGQPAVRFNGSAGQGFVSSNRALTTAQTVIAIVVNQPASNSAGTLTSANASGALQLRLVSGKPNFVAQLQAELGTGTLVAPATGAVVTGNYDPAAGAAWWINGAAAGTATIARTLVSEYTTLGLNPRNNGEVFIGDLLDVMRWNRLLTTTERARVHTYAQDRYGIPVTDYSTAA